MHMCVWCPHRSEDDIRSSGTGDSHNHVGTGNQTHALWKGRQCSWLLSRFSNLPILLIEGLSLAENMPSQLSGVFRRPRGPTCLSPLHPTPVLGLPHMTHLPQPPPPTPALGLPRMHHSAWLFIKAPGTELGSCACTGSALKSDPCRGPPAPLTVSKASTRGEDP